MREELQKSMTIKGKYAGIKEECNGIVGFAEGKNGRISFAHFYL